VLGVEDDALGAKADSVVPAEVLNRLFRVERALLLWEGVLPLGVEFRLRERVLG